MRASGRNRAVGRVGWALAIAALGSAFAVSCAAPVRQELTVTATAYNSLPGQTQGDPNVAAWGDRLAPGMRVVAVSRDLIGLGLTRGARVWIEGVEGEYVVLDKTAARWTRRIDIYMGTDVEAALRWGKRKVQIHWTPAE